MLKTSSQYNPRRAASQIRIKLSRSLPLIVPALFAFILFAGGCAKKEEIVAKAGKKGVTVSEYKEAMLRRFRTEEFAAKRGLEERQKVVQTLVEGKLKLQDAYRMGLDKDSTVVANASEKEKHAAVQELYKVEVLDMIIPPEAIREYYDKMGEEIHARHILFKSYVDMTPNELDTLKARAEKVLAQLKTGADFDSMARALSEDATTAQRGGDLGYFSWGKMVDEFQDAAFAMKIGEMSDLVQSQYGFHIIRLEDRRQTEKMPEFEDEEDNIRLNLRRVYQKELSEAAAAYLEKLKEEAGLWFDYANIQKILDKVSDPSVPRNQDYFANFSEEEKNWAVAVVKGDTITVRTLSEETAKTGPPRWRDQKAIIQTIERMFLPDMLADRARAIGIYKHKTVKDTYKTNLELEMIRQIEKVQVDDKIDLSDDILLEYYKEHPVDFQTDSTVEVQEIYILVRGEDDKDESYAKMVAKKAKSGENFTKLVKKYNDRKSTMGRDGKIGPITSRQYGAMGIEAFKLEIGEVGGPIKMGTRGYSVIKLLDKTPARVKPFEECKTQVERAYQMEQTQTIRKDWMAELEDRYKVTIYDDKLMEVLPQPEEVAADTSKKEEPKFRTIPIGGEN